jgi:hypothetical protein
MVTGVLRQKFVKLTPLYHVIRRRQNCVQLCVVLFGYTYQGFTTVDAPKAPPD